MIRRTILLGLVPLLLTVGPIVGSAPILGGCEEESCDAKVEEQRNSCISQGGEPVDCYAEEENDLFTTECKAQCVCIYGGSG